MIHYRGDDGLASMCRSGWHRVISIMTLRELLLSLPEAGFGFCFDEAGLTTMSRRICFRLLRR